MGIIDRLVGSIAAPAVNTGVSAPKPQAGYMRNNRHVGFLNWRPALRSSQSEVSEAWDMAAARAHESIINSGWLSGAVEQAVADTVGEGVKVKPAPENAAFGQDVAWARSWGRMVSAKFDLWASTPALCDAAGRRTLYQMQADSYLGWIGMGETLSMVKHRREAFYPVGTKFKMFSPSRLSRHSDEAQRIVNGVKIDADGRALAYSFNAKTAAREDGWNLDYDNQTVSVNARDRYGRPIVNHVFTGRAETYRGIGPMVPVLLLLRQFDQLNDGTLSAALLQSLFAAVITSSSPTEEVLEGLMTQQELREVGRGEMSRAEVFLDAQAGYYSGQPIDVGSTGRIGHLFPGDELKFLTTEATGPDRDAFSRAIQREICRCLGVSYSSGTGDYAGTTYYSLGKSNDDIFAITKKRRADVVAPGTQPIYDAWLEEAIEVGYVEFPGGIEAYHYHRHAASRSIKRGDPKPISDVLKAMKANEVARRCGWVSDSQIAEQFGWDYEDVCQRLSDDKALREEYGIPEPVFMNAGGGAPTEQDEEKEGDDDRDA